MSQLGSEDAEDKPTGGTHLLGREQVKAECADPDCEHYQMVQGGRWLGGHRVGGRVKTSWR